MLRNIAVFSIICGLSMPLTSSAQNRGHFHHNLDQDLIDRLGFKLVRRFDGGKQEAEMKINYSKERSLKQHFLWFNWTRKKRPLFAVVSLDKGIPTLDIWRIDNHVECGNTQEYTDVLPITARVCVPAGTSIAATLSIPSGTVVPSGTSIAVNAAGIPIGAKLPLGLNITPATVIPANTSIPLGFILPVGFMPSQATRYPAGTILPDGFKLTKEAQILIGTVIEAGTNIPTGTNIAASVTQPAGIVLKASLAAPNALKITTATNIPSGTVVSPGLTIPAGTIIPSGLIEGDIEIRGTVDEFGNIENELSPYINAATPLNGSSFLLIESRYVVGDPTKVFRAPFRALTWSVSTTPFRYRFKTDSTNSTLSSTLSASVSFGYTFGNSVFTSRLARHRSNTVSIFTGLSTADIKGSTVKEPKNWMRKKSSDRTNGAVSYGISYTRGINNFGFVLSVGADTAFGPNSSKWSFQNKPWIGIGVNTGLGIF